MGEPEEKEPTRHVYVSVAEREVYGGWWAAGRKWEPGQHEAHLTLKQIENVASRGGVVVVDAETGKRYGKAAQPAPLAAQKLSADEQVALAEYRRHKARNPEIAEQYSEPDEEEAPPPKAPAPKPGSQLRGPPPEQQEQTSRPPSSDLGAPPADAPASMSTPSSSSSAPKKDDGKGKDKK